MAIVGAKVLESFCLHLKALNNINMLGITFFKDSKEKEKEDNHDFSISFLIGVINLAFGSFFFPLNTLLQLIKFINNPKSSTL